MALSLYVFLLIDKIELELSNKLPRVVFYSVSFHDHHCQEDGDMVTFKDDATFYFGHEDMAEA